MASLLGDPAGSWWREVLDEVWARDLPDEARVGEAFAERPVDPLADVALGELPGLDGVAVTAKEKRALE